MNRLIIELHCQRILKETVYDGSLQMHSVPGEWPEQRLNFSFTRKDLGDVGVTLHHLINFVAGITPPQEFCVRMSQKAPDSQRPALVMDLTLAQVNKIQTSPESARAFFAPIFIERKVKQGENLQDVIEEEIENATKDK